MGQIALEGLLFYAYHGYYDEEQVLGNTFQVDIYLSTNLGMAGMIDNINAAVNYETIYLLVKYEMVRKARLLETLADKIATKIKKQFPQVHQVKVKISKHNPPLGGTVKRAIVENTGTITLEGMEFYAYHGVSEEEKTLGNYFVVDATVKTNIKKAAASDDLKDTLNYEALYVITRTEMKAKAQLLENIAHRIEQNLKAKYDNIENIKLSIKKRNPYVRGSVPEATIETETDLISRCAKCGKSMPCYMDENCWCTERKIYPATQEFIDDTYGGCLCSSCRSFYEG